MIVHIQNRQSYLPFIPSSIEEMVSSLLEKLSVKTDEISFHFVSKEEIGKLHDEFFDDPSPTDCITFPIDSPNAEGSYHLLGEVFICPEVALEYASTHKIDPYEELKLYVIHGILHLLGYDDIEEEDREEMRSMEKHCFSLTPDFPIKKLV